MTSSSNPRFARHGLLAVAMSSIVAAAPASAAGLDFIQAGYGNGQGVSVTSLDLGVNDRWLRDVPWVGNHEVYWIGRLQYWSGHASVSESNSVGLIGISPVIRFRPTGDRNGLFIDAGLGVNLITRTHINLSRRFSTAFQFGEIASIGTSFGARNEYEVALRLQHVSNGSIKRPNSGLTAGMGVLSYKF